jgi:hypothetical protein
MRGFDGARYRKYLKDAVAGVGEEGKRKPET